MLVNEKALLHTVTQGPKFLPPRGSITCKPQGGNGTLYSWAANERRRERTWKMAQEVLWARPESSKRHFFQNLVLWPPLMQEAGRYCLDVFSGGNSLVND